MLNDTEKNDEINGHETETNLQLNKNICNEDIVNVQGMFCHDH